MAGDYIPRKEGDYMLWQQNLITVAQANLVALGLVAADMTPIVTAQGEYESAFVAVEPAEASAKAARQARADARDLEETLIRRVVRKIQANPNVPDQLKQQLGITVAEEPSTPPVPSSKPNPDVEDVDGLQQVIRFTDSTSGKRARPSGVKGIEVRMTIGTTPPADPNGMPIVGVISKMKLVQNFSGADAGKTAYYWMRYLNSLNQAGPWSNPIAATIAA